VFSVKREALFRTLNLPSLLQCHTVVFESVFQPDLGLDQTPKVKISLG
jgi:hypothetical protein